MRKITIDEFIDVLAKTANRKHWYITEYGRIRCLHHAEDETQCPITSVKDRPISYVGTVAMDIGLSDDDMRAVISSADNIIWGRRFSKPLREKMLIAVGLKEN